MTNLLLLTIYFIFYLFISFIIILLFIYSFFIIFYLYSFIFISYINSILYMPIQFNFIILLLFHFIISTLSLKYISSSFYIITPNSIYKLFIQYIYFKIHSLYNNIFHLIILSHHYRSFIYM
jgi:hypothetical protein